MLERDVVDLQGALDDLCTQYYMRRGGALDAGT